jgi:hypothetical protein
MLEIMEELFVLGLGSERRCSGETGEIDRDLSAIDQDSTNGFFQRNHAT